MTNQELVAKYWRELKTLKENNYKESLLFDLLVKVYALGYLSGYDGSWSFEDD